VTENPNGVTITPELGRVGARGSRRLTPAGSTTYTLQYEAIVEDPNVFEGPWVVARNFLFRPEFDVVDEFVCENNRDCRDLFEKK
jgi:hypothetical protein